MIIQSGGQSFHFLQPGHDANQLHHQSQSQSETDNHVQQSTGQPSTAPQQSLAQQRQINELRSRDQEVRAHELAHLAAAGGLSKGGASFEFVVGPDGQRYAVAGEVQIDTGGVPGDPEATLQKALQIQQAALAPAQPSAQDRSVAIAAAALAAEARAEIASQRQSEGDDEAVLQRTTAKINEAYNANPEADTQRTDSVINLIA